MNYIDLIIAIPLLWGLYKGFTKGLIIELAALVSLCLGVFGALKFSDFVAEYCTTNFGWTSEYMPLIAFAITFIGIVLLVYLVAKVIEQFIRLAALGVVNRVLGAMLGVCKFALIISCLIYAFNAVGLQERVLPKVDADKSLLLKHVAVIAPTVIPAFKESKLNIELPNGPLTTMR